MGFKGLPQVDSAAINNERAKKRLELHFERAVGFIAREQHDDMGVDYKVELIEGGGTNWSFDIQLKSVESPKFIHDRQFVTFPLSTVNLHYLCRNVATYGLLVLYDVGTDIFYFDYVDALHLRLLEQRGDRDWQDNGQVSLNIPVENVLNKVSVSQIYDRFLHRFKNLEAMNRAHGADYGLPHVPIGQERKNKVDGKLDAFSELTERGLVLLAQKNLARVYALLEILPQKQILGDREVLLVAAFAYHEVGRLAESVYYTGRLLARYELNGNERRKVDFLSLKNALNLAEIDRKTFVERARLLLPGAEQFQEISFRLKILYFELAGLRGFDPLSPGLVTEFEELEGLIVTVEDESSRHYFRALNLENLAVLVSHERKEDLNRKAVFGQLGMEMGQTLREHFADKDAQLYFTLHQGLADVGKYSIDSHDFVLLAGVTVSSLKFWLDFQWDLVVFGSKGISRDKLRLELQEQIGLALETSTVLEGQLQLRQAYVLLSLAWELILVSKDWHGFEDGFELAKLEGAMRRLEGELELPLFVSQLQLLMGQVRYGKHNGFSGVLGLETMDDIQLGTYARYVLESGRYPNAKLEHIIHEMSAFRTFYRRNVDDRLAISVLRPHDERYTFTFEHAFSLKDRVTGIESAPGTNMETLLEGFGL